MQLFFDPQFDPASPALQLDPDEARHALKVLRLEAGDTIRVTDGRGNLYTCRIDAADRRTGSLTLHAEGVETDCGRLPYRLTIAVAPTKNIDRFEWFLEKATEVGVSEIIPIETAHSERRTLKTERAAKVVAAAVKQSLKCYCPQLHELTPFAELMSMPFAGRKFIAHCDDAGERRFLGDLLRAGEDAVVLIGPEGDFSPEEIAAALAHGFEPVTLGRQRLRTETAAVVATVIAAAKNN